MSRARRCFRRGTRTTDLPDRRFPGATCSASSKSAAAAELPESICNHTFRGTGITVFLQNGGSLEAAQDMANHTDPRTTKLDRRIAFE
jgi:site-specific recombinase XerD